MHIRHLRKLAAKILGFQCMNVDSQDYFIRNIQDLCKSVFRDCCIELEVSTDSVERAASSTNHAQYLIQSIESRCPLPIEIKKKYQEVCSSLKVSTIRSFLIVVPYVIQNIKDIFVDEMSEVPQNGLRGLHKEKLDELVSSVRKAEENHSRLDLFYCLCDILEPLCLENYGKEANTEIENWGESMAILPMLNYLKPFFHHSYQDVRLHNRLHLVSRCLRKSIADREYIDDVSVHDLSNVLMSLIEFAKTDPSKVVRFELNGSTDLPCSCTLETVRYDKLKDTYSQVFRISKKETEEELYLHATARVYINGEIVEIGTFQSTIMLTSSSESALNEYITRSHDFTVTKLRDKNSGNLRVVFFSAQKEKLLDIPRKELRQHVVDLNRSTVTQCPLSIRSRVTLKADKFLSLRLMYKWGSEVVLLDSKDFEPYARSSHVRGVGKSKSDYFLRLARRIFTEFGEKGFRFALVKELVLISVSLPYNVEKNS